MYLKRTPTPRAVLFGGGVSVATMDKTKGKGGRRTSAIDPAVAERIHAQVSRLRQVHPVPGAEQVQVVIRKPGKGEEEGWLAKTMRGSKRPSDMDVYIDMNADEFALFGKEDSADKLPGSSGALMPVAMEVPDSVYAMTHEWGHAHDLRDDAAVAADDTEIAADPELSEARSMYAESNGLEAYAEAYAEWMLTGGQTSNALARWFATKYDWPTEGT